ncbi:unnamed protein product [Fusarium venenatum]|uniref:NACHT domain-containing protein n=1 Tax=Fusarium venenatum TaxID=56646 RepID=A0A2L2THS8_9HYPO|nr:uncharacterized protein FVRRES_10601 [Fusarium venenatum]CEI70524.1 unnamed protein product [Fusarium venenatum]
MSGAEALAGIGILCNVMQIVTFGKDALHVYRYIRENGSPDAKLEVYLADATMSYQEMRTQLSGTTYPTSDQKEIIRVGEEAYKGLQKFRTYFEELSVDKGSRKGFRGKFRIAKSGIKTLFRGKELEDLEKNFQRYEQLLQTRLINRVCNQSDATALLAQESFETLNDTQQCMVQKIAQGHTDISSLLSQTATDTKLHISNQHQETRTTLGHHLSVTEHKLQSQISESTFVIQEDLAYRNKTENILIRHNQLLASLRYPEMNGRKNHVVTSFPKTFQWIFSSKGPWEEESSSDDESMPSLDEISDEEIDMSDVSSSDKGQSEDEEKIQDSNTNKVEDEPATSGILDKDDTVSTASSDPEPTVFARWLGSDSKMFWISGKPASGKSTLMKFISTNPSTKEHLAAWRPNARILCHYFWKAGSVLERSLKGFLLSLTHQVLLDNIELSQLMWEDMPEVRHKWSHADWDLQQLETALLCILKAATEPFLLIIDGLDECDDLERQLSTLPQRPSMLDLLRKLEDIKICVSSREEYTFITYFDGVERLQLHELTKYDIRQFADTRLDGLSFAEPEDREELLDLIVLRAAGVFLWVALVLDSISRAIRIDNSIGNLTERVNHMPRDLIDLVREMWERSGEDGEITSYRHAASRYFNLAQGIESDEDDLLKSTILLLAIASDKQDLESMLDIDHVWSIDELEKMCSRTEDELRIVCHGLLEVKEEGRATSDLLPERIDVYRNKQVLFAHRCVIDFLRTTESGAALLGACGWCKDEVKARLEGTFMILYRSVFKPGASDVDTFLPTLFDEIINDKRYILRREVDNSLDRIMRHLDSFDDELPYRNLLLRKCIEWHFTRNSFNRSTWACSGKSIFVQDPLRNEFLASAAKAGTTSFMETLLGRLSSEDFLSSLPAIFRGLSAGYGQDETEIGGPEESSRCVIKIIALTKLILSRLLSLKAEAEETMLLKAVTGETTEELQRLACSWFLGIWIGFNSDQKEKEIKTSVHEILHLVTLSLPTMEDWNESILLFLGRDTDDFSGQYSGPLSFFSQTGPALRILDQMTTSISLIFLKERSHRYDS